MEGGFPYGDIIVIAAIAAFIILRYRAMLGEKSGRDVSEMGRPIKDLEPVIQLPKREVPAAEPVKKAIENEPKAFADQFSAMRTLDPEFSVEEFLTGAKAAYEMVIEAYNEGDDETLKMLLADPIYKEFKGARKANTDAGRVPHTTLVAIMKAEVADAKLRGNKAIITVDFHSEQIPLVRDKDGTIVEGDVNVQEAVEDQWVFERDLKSSDPAWTVTDT